jgi:hypothetical protein
MRSWLQDSRVKSLTHNVLVLVVVNVVGFLFLFLLIQFGVLSSLLFEAMLVAATFSSILFFLISRLNIQFRRLLQAKSIIIGVLLFILFAQGTLLNIDRSRSLYILSWAHHQKIGIIDNTIVISGVISSESTAVQAISQRVQEHIQRGLMATDGNLVSLTKRGEMYYDVADFLAKIFNLRGWKQNKV